MDDTTLMWILGGAISIMVGAIAGAYGYCFKIQNRFDDKYDKLCEKYDKLREKYDELKDKMNEIENKYNERMSVSETKTLFALSAIRDLKDELKKGDK